MTAKRDSESKSEQAPPKVEKEKLRDLTLEHEAEGVRGGAFFRTEICNQATCDSSEGTCGS